MARGDVTNAEWVLAGVFQNLMDGLIAEAAARGQVDLTLVSVDSTVARAHQDAAGMAVSGEVLDALEAAFTEEKKRGSAGAAGEFSAPRGSAAPGPASPGAADDPAREQRRRARRRRKARARAAELGRSRGGLTNKIHLSSDRACRPLSFILTPGQSADSPQFRAVLEKIKVRGPVGRPATRPKAAAADKAYSSRANRAYLRKRRIKGVIPVKADQAANRKKKGSRGGREHAFDCALYQDRNTVERCINKLKSWRGIATR